MTPAIGGASGDRMWNSRGRAGEYWPLEKYLRARFADRVVLTFGEIEDLLGFPLPEPARNQPEWWNDPDPLADRSAQAEAWTLASRTAQVNLASQRVIFDRTPSCDP